MAAAPLGGRHYPGCPYYASPQTILRARHLIIHPSRDGFPVPLNVAVALDEAGWRRWANDRKSMGLRDEAAPAVPKAIWRSLARLRRSVVEAIPTDAGDEARRRDLLALLVGEPSPPAEADPFQSSHFELMARGVQGVREAGLASSNAAHDLTACRKAFTAAITPNPRFWEVDSDGGEAAIAAAPFAQPLGFRNLAEDIARSEKAEASRVAARRRFFAASPGAPPTLADVVHNIDEIRTVYATAYEGITLLPDEPSVVLITSDEPKAGKTLVWLRTAVAAAQSMRVLRAEDHAALSGAARAADGAPGRTVIAAPKIGGLADDGSMSFVRGLEAAYGEFLNMTFLVEIDGHHADQWSGRIVELGLHVKVIRVPPYEGGETVGP